MRFRDMIREIRDLDVHSPEEWEGYLENFEDAEGLRAYLSAHPPAEYGEILARILNQRGAGPAGFDMELSPKAVPPAYLGGSEVRSGRTLGVVSGCFDLLHIGHIRGIAYAGEFIGKYQEPMLCALTLSDEDIRAKKGEGRPVLDLNERLLMLCNLRFVDYAAPLETPNCLAAIEALRPDYFFKTKADKMQGIIRDEIDLVESYGGTVVFFPETESGNVSTTKIIKSVRRRFHG